MQDLIAQIAQKLGVAPDKAEQAVGIMLSLVRSQGDNDKVAALFEKLPGAAELADRHGSGGGGGLMGMLGGPMAALGQFNSAGLSLDQVKSVGTSVLDHARAEAGDDLVRDVTDSIPGLSSFV